jgi:hypothetical protein
MCPKEALHYFKSWLQNFIKFKGVLYFGVKMDDAKVIAFCINRLTVRHSDFTFHFHAQKICCDSLFLFHADWRCQ